MREHTKGPWEWKGKFLRSVPEQSYVLLGSSGSYGHIEGTPADKALVAAAPELLAACKMALIELAHAHCRDNREHTHCLKCKAEGQLKAAIAEADKERTG